MTPSEMAFPRGSWMIPLATAYTCRLWPWGRVEDGGTGGGRAGGVGEQWAGRGVGEGSESNPHHAQEQRKKTRDEKKQDKRFRRHSSPFRRQIDRNRDSNYLVKISPSWHQTTLVRTYIPPLLLFTRLIHAIHTVDKKQMTGGTYIHA